MFQLATFLGFLPLAIVYGGATHLGNIEIDNEGISDVHEDVAIVVFSNECPTGLSVQERADRFLGAFQTQDEDQDEDQDPCIKLLKNAHGNDEGLITFTYSDAPISVLMVDISDIDECDYAPNLEHLCIEKIFSDTEGEASHAYQFENCIDVPVYENGPYNYGWHLDGLNQDIDYGFQTYNGNEDALNIYVLDTGIIADHIDFGGRVIDLYGNGWNTAVSDGDHGTHVASTIAGEVYGVVQENQNIYNVYVINKRNSFTGRGLFYFCDLVMGLKAVIDHLMLTKKRGVVNMSLVIGYSPYRSSVIDSLFREIIYAGGIPVSAAGNNGYNACGRILPADSQYGITVGNYDRNFVSASSSNYGECVDIWGPGTSVWGAVDGTDAMGDYTRYGLYTGTSMASPHIAGIVANWLLECDKTAYTWPCSFYNIKQRLQEWTVEVGPRPFGNSDQCGNTGVECRAAQYFCGRPFHPRQFAYETCESYPCAEDEAGFCRVYNAPSGCSQCWDGYYKVDYDTPCVSCSYANSPYCLNCNDFFGCSQCAGDFQVEIDDFTGHGYCVPQPCLNPDNHCRVCNNGRCSQCEDGYVLSENRASCYVDV